MTKANGEVYSVYGDHPYPLSPYVITPFRGAIISADQMRFNKKMLALRECVEWTFGKNLTLFAFLDYKNQSTEKLKAGLFWCFFMHIV